MQDSGKMDLKLYDPTDKADLQAGYNASMRALESYLGAALPCYVLASGDAALPSGAKRPCLIIVPSKGEIWYDDGK